MRLVGLAAAGVAWLGGAGLALAGTLAGRGVRESFLLAGVLVLGAVIGVLGARLGLHAGMPGGAEVAAPVTAISGALAAVGLALPAAAASPAEWSVLAFAAAGAAVAAPGWWRTRAKPATAGAVQAGQDTGNGAPPAPSAGQVAAGAAIVLGGAALSAAPVASSVLWAALAGLGQVWGGWPAFDHAVSGAVAAWPGWLATPAAPAVLALATLACWQAPVPAPKRPLARAAALAVAALAAGSVPRAAGLPGWTDLAILTALAAALLISGSVLSDRAVAGTASVAGMVAGVSAALWSLATPVSTIGELAALIIIGGVAAAMAREALPAGLTTAGVLAAATGLAVAVPHAAGVPAAAGFAVLCVAVIAVGASTLLRRACPVQALALDLGAAPIVLIAVLLALPQAGLFSALAAVSALLAAGTACVRHGMRRDIAAAAAAVTAVAAVIPQAALIARAVRRGFPHLAPPWQGIPAMHAAGLGLAGLPLALAVLAAGGAAVVIAAGAWRGRQGILDAAAVAMPVVAAPVAVSGGLNYGIALAVLLALTLALTGWAAASRSLAPAGAALAAVAITVTWALAAPAPTLIVLGVLSLAYPLCTWRARLPAIRTACAAGTVLSVSALAGCSALAAGLPGWQARLAVLAAAAAAQLAAGLLAGAAIGPHPPLPGWPGRGPRRDSDSSQDLSSPAHRRDTVDSPDWTDLQGSPVIPAGRTVALAVELAGWLIALAAITVNLGQPSHASISLAAGAALCLGTALRPERRYLLWAGLTLAEAALCVLLASRGIRAPEPYATPAALILIGFGWQRSRGKPQLSSWVTYGPGLALLLLPSLAAAWPDHGWIRPLILGLAAAAVTLTGARSRLQAPALLGAAVVILDAGRQLAPAVAHLTRDLPRWIPIAAIGLVLLALGARFEARLRNLRELRAYLRRMH